MASPDRLGLSPDSLDILPNLQRNLGKAIRLYVERIAQENQCLVGKDEIDGSLNIKSIVRFLRLLNYHGYYTRFVDSKVLMGTTVEAHFIIEDRNGSAAISTEVTFISEDLNDYVVYGLGKIPDKKPKKRR